MRDTRVLDRGEDALDSLREHIDIGVESPFGFRVCEAAGCPAGVDGDVE